MPIEGMSLIEYNTKNITFPGANFNGICSVARSFEENRTHYFP